MSNREESVLDKKNLEPMMATSVRLSCRSCRKSFGSQKSLEVHVRIDHAIQRSKKRSPSPAAGNVEVKPTCGVCGKSFGSKKSVYGHMRTHRNPKNADASSPSSCLDEFDLLKIALPLNWAVTGKRGRKSTSSRTTPENGEVNYEDKEAVQAAMNLIWLSKSNPYKQLIHSPQIDVHDQDQEQKMKGKRKLMEIEEKFQNPMNKNLNRIPSTSGCTPHRCRVCSKSFTTGRALGGHMSSHIVKIKSQANNCPDETSKQMIKKIEFRFDLNELPPMEEDEEVAHVPVPMIMSVLPPPITLIHNNVQ